MKKRTVIILLVFISLIAIILGIVLLIKNNDLNKQKITILDATYNCNQVKEVLYEDSDYKYILPCQKSNSMFIKFSKNDNKVPIKKALDDKLVTIDELIKAGLEVTTEKK